jgi:hypothetical protein
MVRAALSGHKEGSAPWFSYDREGGGIKKGPASCNLSIGIGRRVSPATPATPPDKRVRIRRFAELRSRGKPGKTQLVEALVSA